MFTRVEIVFVWLLLQGFDCRPANEDTVSGESFKKEIALVGNTVLKEAPVRWYLLQLVGNQSLIHRRYGEFVFSLREQVANLTHLPATAVAVNTISYSPHLLVNISLSDEESDAAIDLLENAAAIPVGQEPHNAQNDTGNRYALSPPLAVLPDGSFYLESIVNGEQLLTAKLVGARRDSGAEAATNTSLVLLGITAALILVVSLFILVCALLYVEGPRHSVTSQDPNLLFLVRRSEPPEVFYDDDLRLSPDRIALGVDIDTIYDHSDFNTTNSFPRNQSNNHIVTNGLLSPPTPSLSRSPSLFSPFSRTTPSPSPPPPHSPREPSLVSEWTLHSPISFMDEDEEVEEEEEEYRGVLGGGDRNSTRASAVSSPVYSPSPFPAPTPTLPACYSPTSSLYPASERPPVSRNSRRLPPPPPPDRTSSLSSRSRRKKKRASVPSQSSQRMSPSTALFFSTLQPRKERVAPPPRPASQPGGGQAPTGSKYPPVHLSAPAPCHVTGSGYRPSSSFSNRTLTMSQEDIDRDIGSILNTFDI